MWRPRNETEEDLTNENNAAKILAEKWQVSVHKLSESLYGLDWAFSRNEKVIAFGEFKKRSKKFNTLLLSAAKYHKMVQLYKQTGIPTFLIVEWPEGIYYLDIGEPEMKLNIFMGGNFSRAQNGDLEPIVYIPVDKFTKIET